MKNSRPLYRRLCSPSLMCLLSRLPNGKLPCPSPRGMTGQWAFCTYPRPVWWPKHSALLIACQHFPALPVLLDKVNQERDALLGRLAPIVTQALAEILGSLDHPPPDRSASKVSRKLWRSIHSFHHHQLQETINHILGYMEGYCQLKPQGWLKVAGS